MFDNRLGKSNMFDWFDLLQEAFLKLLCVTRKGTFAGVPPPPPTF